MEYIYSNPSFLLQKFFVRVTNSSTRKSNSLLTHSNQSFDSTDLSDCCTTDFQNRPPSFTRPLIQSWSPWCVFLSKRDREGLWSKGGRGMDASQRRIDPMVSCIGLTMTKSIFERNSSRPFVEQQCTDTIDTPPATRPFFHSITLTLPAITERFALVYSHRGDLRSRLMRITNAPPDRTMKNISNNSISNPLVSIL